MYVNYFIEFNNNKGNTPKNMLLILVMNFGIEFLLLLVLVLVIVPFLILVSFSYSIPKLYSTKILLVLVKIILLSSCFSYLTFVVFMSTAWQPISSASYNQTFIILYNCLVTLLNSTKE